MLLAVSGPWREAFLCVAGLAAGFVNGVAGGGTLVSFPVLLALGLPAVRANVTSTIGIWPGYLGGVAGFRREISDQLDRLRELAPVAAVGGVVGAVLLLVTPSHAFSRAAPYLVLVACALFAVQPILAKHLAARDGRQRRLFGQAGTFVACVYGAYFGAGLGVLLLAILGIAIPDRLIRHEWIAEHALPRGQHDRGDRVLHRRARRLELCRCSRGDKPRGRLRGRSLRETGARWSVTRPHNPDRTCSGRPVARRVSQVTGPVG